MLAASVISIQKILFFCLTLGNEIASAQEVVECAILILKQKTSYFHDRNFEVSHHNFKRITIEAKKDDHSVRFIIKLDVLEQIYLKHQ